MKTVSVENMRKLDERTINEAGIPGKVLMQRAGDGAGEAILEFISDLNIHHTKRIVFLAGKGNNGGDAYVAAKYLYENTNIPVIIYSVCTVSELRGDALLHAQKLPSEIPVLNQLPEFENGDVVVDGLLGTGIKGALRPPYDEWIRGINKKEIPVIALDIPSGLNGDDGSVASDAVKADMTITMGLPKIGFLAGEGPELCGTLRCIDIGIPKKYIDKLDDGPELTFACDVKTLSRRSMSSYKNINGHLLVLGGSRNYQGAPILSAEAAMRSGAGLVSLAVPESSGISIPDMHSIIFRRVPDSGNGTFSKRSVSEINEMAEKADVILVGPGISMNQDTHDMLSEIIKIEKPLVIDADALNIISKDIEILKRKAVTVLTPHHGEMNRLLNGFDIPESKERVEVSKKLASETGAIIVLKGNRTVISSNDGKVRINGSGTPALATAGSGDVLAGMIGAFICQQSDDIFQSVSDAVFIHGRCGECTGFGIRGITADDIVDLIPEKMRDISPFA